MIEFETSVALITGGAQGLGRAFAEHLLAKNVKVSLCDLNESVGLNTQKELEAKYPGMVTFNRCDVTNRDSFEDAIKLTNDSLGYVNIIINNAGIVKEDDSHWEASIQVNVIGVTRGTRLGFQYMSRSNGGRGGVVVNIASIAAFERVFSVPIYSATKAFVNHLTRCYGTPDHYDTSGVKVLSICPGLTYTNILGLPLDQPSSKEKLQKKFPGQIFQTPEHVGQELLTVLEQGENGSVWVISQGKPAKHISFSKTEY